MTNLFKKEKQQMQHNTTGVDKFYFMLIKMKNKRPNFNVHWIMSNLYGKEYEKLLKK